MRLTRAAALLLTFAGLTTIGRTPVAAAPPGGHAVAAALAAQRVAAASPATKRSDLPASDEQAKATLETSPLHGEWVGVMNVVPSRPRLRTYVVHPVRQTAGPMVMVISDHRGMSDWIRAVGHQLAQEGFTAVVPDLWSGLGPNGGDTESFTNADEMTKAIGQLPREEIIRRLQAVWDFGFRLPAITDKSAIIGFGSGGSQSFDFAAGQPTLVAPGQPMLNAAVVFDAQPPMPSALSAIQAPVLGLYAGDDLPLVATIDGTAAEMKRVGKSFESVVFAGASRGFVRDQRGRPANATATEQAWPKAVTFLKQHTN